MAITNNLHDAHKLANGGDTITWGPTTREPDG